MKLWRTPPVDPVIAVLVEQNQQLVSQNIALVERVGKLIGQLARAEPREELAGKGPLRSVGGGRPSYNPEYWRSDEAAEVEGEGGVVLDTSDPEAVEAVEQALRESFRQSLKESR